MKSRILDNQEQCWRKIEIPEEISKGEQTEDSSDLASDKP